MSHEEVLKIVAENLEEMICGLMQDDAIPYVAKVVVHCMIKRTNALNDKATAICNTYNKYLSLIAKDARETGNVQIMDLLQQLQHEAVENELAKEDPV